MGIGSVNMYKPEKQLPQMLYSLRNLSDSMDKNCPSPEHGVQLLSHSNTSSITTTKFFKWPQYVRRSMLFVIY